jgi:predicted alpha/beta-fold hydrolase
MSYTDGLTGGSHESYVRSILTEATKSGRWRGVVLNYRGCGFPSVLTSAQFYHGGYT